jgi:hypothetical protein
MSFWDDVHDDYKYFAVAVALLFIIELVIGFVAMSLFLHVLPRLLS